MKLEGSERKVLHALMRAQSPDSAGYVQDSTIAEVTGLSIEEVRDSLDILTEKECAEVAPLKVGYSAYITARGRRLLRQILMTSIHGYTSISEPPQIIPKGLKSYDKHDEHFFFELLPGPRPVGNIPASVCFWRSRIEEKDPAHPHPLGVLSGPNGCGKTSFVKAGLLPHIDASIPALYIDVRSTGFKEKLHHKIHQGISPYFNASHAQVSHAAQSDMSSELSLGPILLVLDQFEHWLLTRQETEITELGMMLKSLAGQQLQTILVVRDYFYDLTEQFIESLGVSFSREEDTVHMHFFPKYHATRVLEAYGQAYQILGDRITREQKMFLREAVDGLCDEEYVLPVRLALLFEMLQGIEWKPEILRKKGGSQGIIKAYLETVFCAEHPNPRYRQHRDAAKAVLRALLPRWIDARKPPIRPQELLVKIAGYQNSMLDWHGLMQILDAEIRLVKPVLLPDSSNVGCKDRQQGKTMWHCCYQMTHEFYVSIVRRLLYPIKIVSYVKYMCITIHCRKG